MILEFSEFLLHAAVIMLKLGPDPEIWGKTCKI